MRRRRKVLSRSLLGLLLATTIGVFAATPAQAYGWENWQVGFAGTGVAPSTGFGFGFWGWCTFGGGVTSGNNGDCQLAQYVHTPSGGGVTCQVSLDITSWSGSGGTFVITGTAAVNPVSATAACLQISPGSATFTNIDSGIPAVPGHFNLGTFAGTPPRVSDPGDTDTVGAGAIRSGARGAVGAQAPAGLMDPGGGPSQ